MYSRINKCLNKLDDNLYAFSEKHPHLQLDFLRETAEYFKQGISKVTNLVHTCANFAAWKDSWCFRGMEKMRLGFISNSITKMFRKIAVGSVDSAYLKVSKTMDNSCANLMGILDGMKLKPGVDISNLEQKKQGLADILAD